jgi:hypothetical protein
MQTGSGFPVGDATPMDQAAIPENRVFTIVRVPLGTPHLGCAKYDSALRPRLLDLPHPEVNREYTTHPTHQS